MSLTEIGKLSESLGNLLWLSFSGGEIYLREDLTEITRIFYEQNRPSIILFPTNGIATRIIFEKTKVILERCPESIIVVKLSLDGQEEMHDSIRKTNGAFKRCMETYEALKQLQKRFTNFELGINSVFCSTNQDQIANFLKFTSSLEDIRAHSVSLIRGEPATLESEQIDINGYLSLSNAMDKSFKHQEQHFYSFKGGKLKAAVDSLQRRLIYQTIAKQKRQIPCYAGRLNLVLTETGDVFPCESFSRQMGNLRNHDYNFNRLLATSKAQNVLADIQRTACFCSHECYFLTNILFNPSQYPRLLVKYSQLFFKKPAVLKRRSHKILQINNKSSGNARRRV